METYFRCKLFIMIAVLIISCRSQLESTFNFRSESSSINNGKSGDPPDLPFNLPPAIKTLKDYDPAFNYNFTNGSLDPTLTFNRDSTATYRGQDGLLHLAARDMPRFEWSDDVPAKPLGILIEDSSINYANNSEDLSFWATPGIVSSDVIVAPDGSMTGDRLHGVSGSQQFVLRHSIYLALTANNYFSASAWVKGTIAADQPVYLQLYGYTVLGYNQTIYSQDIRGVYPKWTRIHATGKFNQKIYGAYTFLQLGTASGTASWTSTDVNIWGIQVEPQINPTSYMPTGSGQFYRDAESLVLTDTASYKPEGGTFILDVIPLDVSKNYTPALSLAHNYEAEEILMKIKHSGVLTLSLPDTSEDTPVSLGTNFWQKGQKQSFGITYSSSLFNLTRNGTLIMSRNQTDMPASLDNVRIGSSIDGTTGNLYVQNFKYFDVTPLKSGEAREVSSSLVGPLTLITSETDIVVGAEPLIVNDFLSGGTAPFTFLITSGSSGSLS